MSWPAHSRLLTAIAAAFPSLCTIQAPANTNTKGDVAPAYANVSGMSNLPCRVSPVSGSEVRGELTYNVTTHTITLAGRYNGIAPHMQATVGGTAYDIEAVAGDGSGVMTRLSVRVVT